MSGLINRRPHCDYTGSHYRADETMVVAESR